MRGIDWTWKRMALAVLLMLGAGPARAQVFTQADKSAILAGHNQARCAVNPTAQVMPALVWRAALEVTAQAWANACVDVVPPFGLIDHNPNRSNGHPYYVGENIYASMTTALPTQAVQAWVAEAANYDYANNTCNGECGHYTQVVWGNTLELGCARSLCPGLVLRSSIVCDYGPGGNVVGQRPYVAGTGITAACDTLWRDGFQEFRP
jgi:hypothetical protein